MASKQNARIGNQYRPVSTELKVNTLRMSSQDIAHWKKAIDSARNPLMPKRRLLYELYDNIALDGHLDAVMEKRIIAITNKKVLFQQKDNEGVVNDSIQEFILETPWFNRLLSYAMEAVAYGHSLIELVPEKGAISRVDLINRANVIPERGFVMFDVSNESSGIPYRNDPAYSRYLLEVGGAKDYGKLMIAAQYVIYKRGGFGDWAQFAELFGMPFRVGKYNPYDDATRRKLNEALEQAGGAGWIVIPEGSSLEFKDNNGAGKSEVYKDLVDVCNSEISKIFLGQTMTTDNGSSRSQSEVHKEVEEEVNLSDMQRIQYLLNWELKDKLAQMGYPVNDGAFMFERLQYIPLDKRIEIDLKVSGQVPIAEEYWYQTYGIPKPDGSSRPPAVDPDDDDPEPDPEEEEQNLTARITRLYSAHRCSHPEHNIVILKAGERGSDKIMARLSRAFHEGKIRPGSVDPELYQWIARELFAGVTKGFGGGFDKFYIDEPDYKMLAHLEKNVHVFSAFKTYQQLREATDRLTGKDGKLRPFSEFKNDMLAIDEKYNVNWLNAEYNQAVASSQMASRWVDIEASREVLPLLRYTTAGDDRVRASHAALDGIIKPVDDPFWDTYFPPNAWGCRCDVQQLGSGKVTGDKRNLPTLPKMFATNSAKRGVVFPHNHPYYNVRKEDKDQANQLWGLDVPDKNKKS